MKEAIADIVMQFYIATYSIEHSGVKLVEAQNKAVNAILKIVKCKKK